MLPSNFPRPLICKKTKLLNTGWESEFFLWRWVLLFMWVVKLRENKPVLRKPFPKLFYLRGGGFAQNATEEKLLKLWYLYLWAGLFKAGLS